MSTILDFIDSIAREAHKHCPPNHPAGEHEYTEHRATSTAYAKFFWYNVEDTYGARDIVDGIIGVAGDPATGNWKGHPHPGKVLQWIEEEELHGRGIYKRGRKKKNIKS